MCMSLSVHTMSSCLTIMFTLSTIFLFNTPVKRGFVLDPNASSSSFQKNEYANNKDHGLRLEVEDVICGDKGTKAYQLFSLLRDRDRTKGLLTTHDGYIRIFPTPSDAEELNLHRLARQIGFAGSRALNNVQSQGHLLNELHRAIGLRRKVMRRGAHGTHEIKTEGLNLFHPRIRADISQIELPDRYLRTTDAKSLDNKNIPYEEMNSILQGNGVRVEDNPLNDLVLNDQAPKGKCRVVGCTTRRCLTHGFCIDHYEMHQYYDKDNERVWMREDGDEDGDDDEEGGM